MENANKKYRFLGTDEAEALFADVDFMFKSGQHIQELSASGRAVQFCGEVRR
jgi:hypothetical protein